MLNISELHLKYARNQITKLFMLINDGVLQTLIPPPLIASLVNPIGEIAGIFVIHIYRDEKGFTLPEACWACRRNFAAVSLVCLLKTEMRYR